MLRTILTTFFLVFIAELGDKTQIQTMLLATQMKSLPGVFIGAAFHWFLVFQVSWLKLYCQWISPSYLQFGAGISFIIIGILTISGKI